MIPKRYMVTSTYQNPGGTWRAGPGIGAACSKDRSTLHPSGDQRAPCPGYCVVAPQDAPHHRRCWNCCYSRCPRWVCAPRVTLFPLSVARNDGGMTGNLSCAMVITFCDSSCWNSCSRVSGRWAVGWGGGAGLWPYCCCLSLDHTIISCCFCCCRWLSICAVLIIPTQRWWNNGMAGWGDVTVNLQ